MALLKSLYRISILASEATGTQTLHSLSAFSKQDRSWMSIRVSHSQKLRGDISLIYTRFIHAPNSRAKLRITREMLEIVMTYHQIPPFFLDFLLSFGRQHHAKDFFYSGFRHDSRLSDGETHPAIQNLGRSGRILRVSYSLRSVEPSVDQEKWPWSIRETAVYNAVDLETGRSIWLIVKGEGGASMKDRIITETSPRNQSALNRFGSRSEAFSSALSSHLLVCEWSAEHWRWYVNYIEEQVQTLTRKTLSGAVISSPAEPQPQLYFTRSAIGSLVPPEKTTTSKSSKTALPQTIPLGFIAPTIAPQSSSGPPGPPGLPGPPPNLASFPKPTFFNSLRDDSDFSFEDLRKIEHIEERTNDVLLVLSLNDRVLTQIVEHYTSVMKSGDCPNDIRTECSTCFGRFKGRLSDILIEVQIQKARLETLLRLLADRKTLVHL